MMPDAFSLTAVSFGIGIIIVLTGMGRRITLMIPVLVLFGVPWTSGIANDPTSVSISESVGEVTHGLSGSPTMKLVCWLKIGSTPTAFAGAFTIDTVGITSTQDKFYYGSRLANKVSQSVARRAITIALAFTGCAMFDAAPGVLTIVGIGVLSIGPVAGASLKQQYALTYFEHIRFRSLANSRTQPSDRDQRKSATSSHTESTRGPNV